MFLGLFQVALLLGCVFVLGRIGGPLWACAGVGVAFGLYSLLCVASVHRDGAPAPALLARCVRPLLACVPMALAVLAVRAAMDPFGMPALLRLVVEILVGAAAYAGSALVVARDPISRRTSFN
jgi:PST family polysaccharide transporter